MRLLVVVLLTASAFGARGSDRWNNEVKRESFKNEDSFKAGFEYRFHLDSQVSNGLSVPGSQQAAMRMQSRVVLSFPESEKVAYLTIEKIRIASLQKELEQPIDIQPFDLFEEIEINENNLRQLLLPLRFRYETGNVSNIEFDREDSEWSKNIKRVYLNMLQVSLSQNNIDLNGDVSGLYSDKEATYIVPEVTLEGNCEVAYTVLPEETSNERNELRVTKSINFDRCSERVGQKKMYPFLHNMGRLAKRPEERDIEASTVLNYQIAGTESGFLIKEVELRSVYAYAPLSKEQTLFTTFASGKLSLLEVKKGLRSLPEIKSDKFEWLMHSMEWEEKEDQFLATGDESLLQNLPYPVLKNKPQVILRLLKSLLSHVDSEENGIELDAIDEMGRIARVLRLATREDIKRLHEEICQFTENPEMREVFFDSLSLAGSYNSIEHLVEKIRSGDVSPIRAALLLKQIASIPMPSYKIIRSLTSLCKDSKENPLERQACWLTVGSLMHSLCGDLIDREMKCPREIKEEFVISLTEQYEHATTRYEKILALKSLANSGMDLIVFPLEKIIRDERLETIVRTHAVEALRKLRNVAPRKMISLLLPIFKNILERPELRVAAFHQIMHTLPEKSVIAQIAAHLEREPSSQVFSFVYDSLEAFSLSDLPHEKDLADTCRHSLKNIRRKSRKASTYKKYTIYNEKHQSGSSLNWGAIFANDSLLPKEVKSSFETTFTGDFHKHMGQFGFIQHNLDKELFKLLDIFDESLLSDIVVRSKRSAYSNPALYPSGTIRAFFQSLSSSPRLQSREDPHAFTYARFGENDHVFLPLDTDIISATLTRFSGNRGLVNLKEIESFVERGLKFNTLFSSKLYEQRKTLVHSMGMPLTYSSQLPVQFMINGEIKAVVLPRSSKTIDGLKLGLVARPTIAAVHVTKAEIMNPLLNFGVKILHSVQANLPTDITTEMNWNQKFEIKHTLSLPLQSTRLIRIQTRPVSFVRVWPQETRVYVQPKEKTIYIDQLETLVRSIEGAYLEKATGIRLDVHGHVHGHIYEAGNEEIPAAVLIGENNVEVQFERTVDTPSEYIIRAEIELFNENNMTSPSMEKFYEKNNEEHFQTEYIEDFKEEEVSRHAHFNRYVKSFPSGRAISHRLFAEVKSVGSRVPHSAEFELNAACDERMRHCIINLEGIRTPCTEYETHDWKFSTQLEILYPEMPKSLKKLLKQKHRELSVQIESKWGSDESNEMKVKIQGEQNKEQKKWMRAVSKLRDEDLTPLEEQRHLVAASMLNQYKAVVEYDIQSPVSQSIVNRFYSEMKASSPFFKTSFDEAHNEKNLVRLQLTLSPSTQFANFTIHTPSEKVVMHNLRTPSPLPRFNIRSEPTVPIDSLSVLGSSIHEKTMAQCVVANHKIKAFDDSIYNVKLSPYCYIPLVKDCVSENSTFSILIQKIKGRGEQKRVKILTEPWIIDLELKDDPSKREMLVINNGTDLHFVDKLRELGIHHKGDHVVVITKNFTVVFDGFDARVKISHRIIHTHCGVCRRFEGEKKGELRKAEIEETDGIDEDPLSDDEECKTDENELGNTRDFRIVSEDSEEESNFAHDWDKNILKKEKRYENGREIVDPVERQLIIQFNDTSCLSHFPFPECPMNTIVNMEDLAIVEVSFTCFDKHEIETSRLVRQARHEILDLQAYPRTFTRKFRVPKSCIVIE